MLTVAQELIAMGELANIGGAYVLTQLTNNVLGNEPIETYCSYVKRAYVKRKLITVSGEIIVKAYDDTKDAIDLVDEFGKESVNLTNIFYANKYESASEIAAKHLERTKMLQSRKDKTALTGVDTGFILLNRLTFGWQQSDLIILAARPSVGKTAFSLNLARAACNYKTGVGFFSLEMATQQLTSRMIADLANVELEKVNRGLMSSDEFEQYLIAKDEFASFNIHIDDTASISVQEVRSKARQMVKKHGVGLIIIDYLQLMRGSNKQGQNREQEISEISRSLKGLAKELSVHVIALSQLSRAVETRDKSKVPQLSDLRESGAIEQDADMVMFIYRPEYNGEKVDENGNSTKGQTFLKIAKHRNGSLDTIEYHANIATQTFYEKQEAISYGGNFTPVSQIQTFTPTQTWWGDKDKDEETPF
jgi:replicative DNA helicase